MTQTVRWLCVALIAVAVAVAAIPVYVLVGLGLGYEMHSSGFHSLMFYLWGIGMPQGVIIVIVLIARRLLRSN